MIFWRSNLFMALVIIICSISLKAQAASNEVFAVFGDSLAKGIASILDKNRVLDLATVGYGLTQPDYRDKVEWASRLIARYHVRRVIVLLGTNDARPLPSLQDHKLCQIATPCWQDAYKARLHVVQTAFMGAGAQLAWVGIPTMDDPLFDQHLRQVEHVVEEVVIHSGQPFVDVADLFRNQNLHTPDHIHLVRNGYYILAVQGLRGLAAIEQKKFGP